MAEENTVFHVLREKIAAVQLTLVVTVPIFRSTGATGAIEKEERVMFPLVQS